MLIVFVASLFFTLASNAEVIDSAGMFSSSALTSANQKLDEVKRKSGKELVIETIEEVGSADANALALEKAKARKVNGVYVLISKKDRKLKVEIGNKTKLVFGESERNIIKAKFTEEFKRQNFDQGLSSSVDYFTSVMDAAVANQANNYSYPRRTEAPISASRSSGGFPWLSIIIFGVFAFIIFKLISAFLSNRIGANMNQPYGNGYGYGNSGGMGFMGTFLTGLLGAAAGSWLYDKFTGHDSGLYGDSSNYDNYRSNDSGWSQSDSDYSSDSSDSGSDWGGGDGGDFGGGGDW